MTLPDQDELRRRLRAARALRDLSVTELAKRMPADAKLSLSTLRKIESGERKLDPTLLHVLAVHIGVPYAWFTVPDLAAAVLGTGQESVEDRILALEMAQIAISRDLREALRGSVAARHVPPVGGRER
jgi:transcriptional regulator with XRE-family HTH domain